MQQNIKIKHPLSWMTAFAVATVLFIGCNDTATKQPEKMPDSTPVEQKVITTDSLPPLDSTTTSKPEERKT